MSATIFLIVDKPPDIAYASYKLLQYILMAARKRITTKWRIPGFSVFEEINRDNKFILSAILSNTRDHFNKMRREAHEFNARSPNFAYYLHLYFWDLKFFFIFT